MEHRLFETNFLSGGRAEWMHFDDPRMDAIIAADGGAVWFADPDAGADGPSVC